MGYSSWSDDFYNDRASDRKAKGVDAFAYDRVVRTRTYEEQKVHEDLNPKGVIRESRDSDDHPESNAIGVMFDVTGSMGSIPKKLNEKLPALMGLLLRKGYIKDPQILFGCIGDFFSDRGSLQVGQFESGIEMDDDFTKFWLEGGGGGSYEESYQNAMYFFANKTKIDCMEKRGKKGYLFIIGDEKPYPVAGRDELSTIIGDDVQADVPVRTIIEKVQEMYHLFYIIPVGASHGKDPHLKETWQDLIGPQNVLMLDDPAAVCEAIGTAIGVMEGTMNFDRLEDELDHAETALVASVRTGLDPLARSVALAETGSGSLPDAAGRSSTTKRL
jgi:hypothetical protein